MKNVRGITLIALIITIIVLLILAGITISMVVTKNGVMEKTMDAKEGTIYADAKEKLEIEVLSSYDGVGNVDLDRLNNNLRNNLGGVKFKYKDEEEYRELTEDERITELPVKLQYKTAEKEVDGKKNPDYLVDNVEIGEYVDIGVNYNVKDKLMGWRVLSKEGSGAGGSVKLISEGCPLTYYQYHKSRRWRCRKINKFIM